MILDVSILIFLQKDIIDSEIGIYFNITNRADVITSPHQHDFYEVFLSLHGEIDHIINDKEHHLHPNTLVLIRPSDRHYYRNIEGELLNIAFTCEIFEHMQALLQMEAYEQTRIDPYETEAVLEKVQEILAGEWTKKEKALELKKLLFQLLAFFHPARAKEIHPAWLSALLTAMNTRENLTEGLQRLYCLSPKTPEHTTRSFQKYLGENPDGVYQRAAAELRQKPVDSNVPLRNQYLF